MNARKEKIKGMLNLKSFDAKNEFDKNFSAEDAEFEYRKLCDAVVASTSMKLNVYAINNILFVDEVEFVITYNERLDSYFLTARNERVFAKRS